MRGTWMSRPKKVWTCEHGCSNTKEACVHLEALIDDGQGLHKYLSYLPDDVIAAVPPLPPQETLDEPALRQFDYNHYVPTFEDRHTFIEDLRRAGLINEEIMFLVDKFIHNKPVRIIAKEHGFTSKSTAGYFFRKIKKKLKAQGLKLWRAKYDD